MQASIFPRLPKGFTQIELRKENKRKLKIMDEMGLSLVHNPLRTPDLYWLYRVTLS